MSGPHTAAAAATYQRPPEPSLNGGLYSGKPFNETDAWRNFPATPDSGYYNFNVLMPSSDTPARAYYSLPGGGLRPGNNTPFIPPNFAASRITALNMFAVPRVQPRAGQGAHHHDAQQQQFRQYTYV